MFPDTQNNEYVKNKRNLFFAGLQDFRDAIAGASRLEAQIGESEMQLAEVEDELEEKEKQVEILEVELEEERFRIQQLEARILEQQASVSP